MNFPWWVGICAGVLTFVVFLLGMSTVAYILVRAGKHQHVCRAPGCGRPPLDCCSMHLVLSDEVRAQVAAAKLPGVCRRPGCYKPVAYPGALYCGAGCSARAEAKI